MTPESTSTPLPGASAPAAGAPAPPPGPEDSPGIGRGIWAAGAAAALLVAVTVGAALTGPWPLDPGEVTSSPPAPEPAPSLAPAPTVPPGSLEPGEPVDLSWVLVALAVLLALALVWLTAVWVRRRLLPWLATRRERPAPQPLPATAPLEAVPLARLRDAAVQAEQELRGGAVSSDAIIAAWLALEGAAERSGATHLPVQTPTEFTVDVLAATPASPDAVTELLGLYHQARFATRPATPEQIEAAGRALRRLSADLHEPVAAPSGDAGGPR